MVKEPMRKDKKSLNLRTMGISNWVRDMENNKLYSLQFYDYDYNGSNITPETLNRILEIFPLDCLLYATKQGLQFISLALRMGSRYTKSRSVETSKELGKQDYWTTAKDLTLRIAPKWKRSVLKRYKIISKKPKFRAILKYPSNNIISEKHLEFYRKYMGLPDWVYLKYEGCEKRDYKIKIYHYKTSD